MNAMDSYFTKENKAWLRRLKQVLFVCLCLLFSQTSAQQTPVTVKFRVVSLLNFKPISDVRITSTNSKGTPGVTNTEGIIELKVHEYDSVLFKKAFYYPVKIYLSHQNFDLNHVIEIILAPSEKQNHADPHGNLEMFEYHFVHDTLGDKSHVKVKASEHPDASLLRMGRKDNAFHILDVPIDHIRIGHHKTDQSSSYKKADPNE